MPLFIDPMPKKKKKTIATTKRRPQSENVESPKHEKPKKKLKLFSRPPKTKFEKPKAVKAPVTEPEKTVAEPVAVPVKEKKVKTRKFNSIKKRKIKGGLLIMIGLFALAFIGYFLFGKLFSPQDLAEITPAGKTVGVIEIMIDTNHGQVGRFYSLLEKYPVYKRENVIRLVEQVVPYNYENDLYPWLGRKIGAVLYSGAEGSLSPIYFIESRDHGATVKFLKNRRISETTDTLIESDYSGRKIYSFAQSQTAVFTFVNNYLVIAEDEKLIKNYLDHLAEGTMLSGDPDYIKVANNLPRGGVAYGYVNLVTLFETLEKDQLFVSRKGQDLLAFKPFLNVFRAEGISVFADEDRFTAQTFTAIDNEALGGESFITFNEKYQGELLSLAGENPIMLMGGHDLTKEINRIKDVFKSGTKTPALVFEGMLEAQKQIYFGKDINLETDILPLLTGEYLFTVENSLEEPVVSLFLEMDSKTTDIPKFEKTANAFVEVSGIFTPKIRQVELPDGTIGQELVASPEQIGRDTNKYKSAMITTLKLGDTGVSVHYAILGEVIALSTDMDGMKKIIDRHEDALAKGFVSTDYYSKNVGPVLRTADEVFLLKLGALTAATGLNADQNLNPYLVPFNNLTVTKNYFRDGISTIYLIEVI